MVHCYQSIYFRSNTALGHGFVGDLNHNEHFNSQVMVTTTFQFISHVIEPLLCRFNPTSAGTGIVTFKCYVGTLPRLCHEHVMNK